MLNVILYFLILNAIGEKIRSLSIFREAHAKDSGLLKGPQLLLKSTLFSTKTIGGD